MYSYGSKKPPKSSGLHPGFLTPVLVNMSLNVTKKCVYICNDSNHSTYMNAVWTSGIAIFVRQHVKGHSFLIFFLTLEMPLKKF